MNWTSVCCMFGMALTRRSLTMQLTSGVGVFAHVCGQEADFEQILWQYSAVWQETFQFPSNMTRFLNCLNKANAVSTEALQLNGSAKRTMIAESSLLCNLACCFMSTNRCLIISPYTTYYRVYSRLTESITRPRPLFWRCSEIFCLP